MKKLLLLFMILLLPMALADDGYASDLVDGLQEYYSFDDDDSNSTQLNGVHGNINCTYTGAYNASHAGVKEESFGFDGDGDGISCGNNFNNAPDGSVSLWAKINDNTTNNVFATKGGTGTPGLNVAYTLWWTGSYLEATFGNGAAQTRVRYYTPMKEDVWYHIVLVFNSTNATIYFNGTLGNATNLSFSPVNHSNPYLGGRWSNPGGNFELWGYLDEMAIYNTQLTSDLVTQLYNNGSGLNYFQTAQLNYGTFHFYDSDTGAYLSGINITTQLVSPVFSAVETTTSGNFTRQFSIPDNVSFTIDADGYSTYYYNLELASNLSNDVFSIYLDANTTTTPVTMTVFDELGNEVEGATIKVFGYNITSNTFPLEQTLNTNFEGQAKANLILDDKFYKFTISVNGQVLFSSESTRIFSNEIAFTVITRASGFEPGFDYLAVTGTITNTTPSYFAFAYNDEEGAVTRACFTAWEWTRNARTQYNQSCLSTSSGTIFLGIGNTSGSFYELIGNVSKNGEVMIIDSLQVEFKDAFPENNYANWLAGFLVIVLMLIASFRLSAAVVLGGAAPLVLSITGIGSVGKPIAAGILVLGIVAAVIIEAKR